MKYVLITAFLFAPWWASAAIAIQDTGVGTLQNNVSNPSWTFTNNASTNGAVFACVSNEAGNSSPKVATYGGSSMTYLGQSVEAFNTISAWVLLNPPTGSNALAVTAATGAYVMTYATYTGVNQSATYFGGSPTDATSTNQNTGSNSSISQTITVHTPNSWIMSCVATNNGTQTGSTNINSVRATEVATTFGDSNGVVSTGSQTVKWTMSSDEATMVNATFSPAAAAAVSTPIQYFMQLFNIF